MITVIIPYFQRSRGILRRALASIAAQKEYPCPIHVIIVDDASPIPAQAEVDSIVFTDGITIQVITQKNGGPGAARNTGLDHAPFNTRYLAFLDSDDEWSDDHLARACAALDAGYDFYFSDLIQLNAEASAFNRARRIKVHEHRTLSVERPCLHAFEGDMVDQIMRGNIIGTPTVVLRWDRQLNYRFRRDYSNAGEDYLFWLELVANGAKIAFSSQVEATCGRGVNIYSGAGWGSDQYMLRIHNELRYRKAFQKEFAKSQEQKIFVEQAINKLRYAFIQDLMHRIFHRKPITALLLWRQLIADPFTFFQVPFFITKMILKIK